jgi:hypothetical protein
MVNLQTELADAGMALSGQAFYTYFIESLPPSSDLFVTLYDDTTSDVGFLCDKFAKYEMRRKLSAAKSGKGDTSSGDSLALSGQQSSNTKMKQKGKVDRSTRRKREMVAHALKR